MHLTYKLRLIVSFEEIQDLSSGLVRFYSVKLGPDLICEFEKFDAKEFINPLHIEELRIVYATIEQIRLRGAKPYYFKPEGPARALPKITKLMMDRNNADFGLRLYCIHVSESVVILLNGDIKTKQNPRECPNVGIHFDRALKIAKKIQWAMDEDYLRFTEKGIEIDIDIDI